MKTYSLIGGLFVTAAVVCTGSVFTGIKAKSKQNAKQHFKIENITNYSEVNKIYQNTLNSLDLKSQYEKVHLQTLSSLKKTVMKQRK